MVDATGEPDRRNRHEHAGFELRPSEGTVPLAPGDAAKESAHNFRECRTACPGLVQSRAADCRTERLAKEHRTGLRLPGEAGLQSGTRLRRIGNRCEGARERS
jgi:hypothetical protein